VGAFIRELVRIGLYKRTQGRITRQVTFAALALLITIGVWRFGQLLGTSTPEFRFGLSVNAFYGLMVYGLPLVLMLIGGWVSFRIVNFPAFADFLIAVEAEMNKVSWPTRGELFRASMIVLIMIFAFATILSAYDFLWRWLFHILHIV
jgi:preprotein translocase subunit SecE